MKILLSAYACHPFVGSESGVAWNYARELAKKGHEVVILTKNKEKEKLFASEIAKLELKNVHIIYYELPKFFRFFYRPATGLEHLYYFFWQLGLYFFVKGILKKQSFDVIHHVTLGVFRTPSFLWSFKLPFVFGPVGGGENYPFRLKKNLPFKFLATEFFRDAVNGLISFNPFLYLTFLRSRLILCRTQDTLRYIPKKFHNKCFIQMGIGYDYSKWIRNVEETPQLQSPTFDLLYAGRPLYWKGIHLVIQSYALLLSKGINARLTIVGCGDPGWAKKVAIKHQVLDSINWLGEVETSTLYRTYQDADLLIFPSLREAGGTVAIEALCFGLPVVCLDLGGPSLIVNEECGCIIKTKNQREEEVVAQIATEVEALIDDPDLYKQKREMALLQSKRYSWEQVVSNTYSQIEMSCLP